MASSFEPLFAAPPGGDRRAEPRSPAAWFNQLGEGGGFRPAARYSPSPVAADEPDPADAIMADLLADAEARGRQAALAQMASEGAARAALKLSLQRLDEHLQQDLAMRLAETVALLCEATLAPLAIDAAALQARCTQAAACLKDDVAQARLRLHPDDVALLDAEFAASWTIDPDPRLERGTVHFDTADGALRDGPGEWRAALREALGLC
ncbi:MAG: flagellar biosynthesis protein [Erythrobacter sp.]|nr:flagellar biosynthesis protein [Erythrobacter sp.]